MVDVARLVGDAGGVASRRQLLEWGVGRGALVHACRSGQLQRLDSGLFAHPMAERAGWDFRRRRALAWAGPDAVLSFRAAAQLWNLDTRPYPAPVHVSIRHGRRVRSLPDVHVHQWKDWHLTVVAGWPVTDARQTLIDLASLPDVDELRFPALQAIHDGLVTPADLTSSEGVPRRSLGQWNTVGAEAAAGARSGGEGLYWRLLHESALPDPQLNTWVKTAGGDYCVDALWPDLDLVAEIDGRSVHAMEEAFTRDRIRQNALHAQGLLVIRFTVGQVRAQPREVLRATEEMLVTRARQLGRTIAWGRD